MTDRTTTTTSSLGGGASSLLRRLQDRSPPSGHLLGVLALAVAAGALLLLAGITVTAAALGLVLFSPIIFLTAPLWLPVAGLLVGVVAFCGSAAAGVAALAWVYRYLRGQHPPGSDRVDYARSRIADTAREVKDYAREYGGYLHSKVKDAAPARDRAGLARPGYPGLGHYGSGIDRVLGFFSN